MTATALVAFFVTPLVTPRLQKTTNCHDNFGYYCRKWLIPCTPISTRTGIGRAIKSKLVYT